MRWAWVALLLAGCDSGGSFDDASGAAPATGSDAAGALDDASLDVGDAGTGDALGSPHDAGADAAEESDAPVCEPACVKPHAWCTAAGKCKACDPSASSPSFCGSGTAYTTVYDRCTDAGLPPGCVVSPSTPELFCCLP